MTAVSALGAAAMVFSAAFALSTWDRYRDRRQPHQLAWTIAMVMFFAGSAAYWVAGALGWEAWSFRLFYLFGAILNVPFLALGTVYLLGGRRLGDRCLTVLGILAGFCAGVVLAAPMRAEIPASGLPEGRELFGVGPRAMAAIGSGVGATVLIGGALYSAWRLVRGRGAPRLVVTNLFIAAGSIILSLGGAFGQGDREVGFGIALVAGIVVLFAGFVITNRPASPPSPANLPRSVRQTHGSGQVRERVGS